MIGRVKKWLGIEGVKLEVIPPEEVREVEGEIKGSLRFQSLNPQEVTGIKVILIERFSRGRGKEKRIDEYELGEVSLNTSISIPANEIVEVPFQLPFLLALSDMDRLQRSNFVLGGMVSAAKYFRKVKSEYIIVAEAKVKGVALNPFDRKPVLIKR